MQTKMLNLHSLKQKVKGVEFNWIMLILITLFFIGLIFGSFSVKNSNSFLTAKITELYSAYLSQKDTFSSLIIFMYTFLLSMTAVVISFFTGLCALGIPFIVLVPFVSGTVIGTISGFVYETYLLKGLGYCAIIIFPAAAISLVSLISSCKESLLMSGNMLSILATGRTKEQNCFKSYCIKYLVFTLVCAAAALIEAVLFNMFSDLFNF